MANNLTGDYEAVVQVSVRQINGLLATLHQNGASEDAPLKLPHSATVRVGDPHYMGPALKYLGAFREWVRDNIVAGESGALDRFRGAHRASVAPPGAAKMIEDAFSMFGKVEAPAETPGTVRGTVKLQLSSPTISLPDGSTSEVRVHVDVRAHYYPDPGAMGVAVPEHPLHGEVDAAFDLRQTTAGAGKKLHIQPSSQDNKIQFSAAHGTNLSAVEVDRISAQVRKTVRESFTSLPVDLPAGFPFSDFKALGSGSSQAIALPIQLSGAPLPAGHTQSVTNPFIGSSGFAFAVSKEYVEALLSGLSDSIKESISRFKRVINKFFDVYYTARLTSGPSLNWNSGAIEFSVGIKLVNHNALFDFDIVVAQTLTLALKVSTQSVTITPVGDPVQHGSIVIDLIELLGGGIVAGIKAARDEALNGGGTSINDTVQDTFLDAKGKLVQGLKSFDDSASARFTAVEITPDGVIVSGEIGSTARHAPIVQIAETEQGHAFTALHSWIPGGRIERLKWSWVGYPGRKTSPIWSGVTKVVTGGEEHRFILPKPAGVTELSSMCLRIEGTQTTPDGGVVSVAGGGTCHVRDSFGPIMEMPSWWEPVTVPSWLPDSSAGTILKEAIAGHISVQGTPPRKNDLTHNSLVYFAEWMADKPLEPLVRALAAMKRKKVSLVLIVVLPAGAFDSRRREVEAKLDSIAERFPAQVLLTEDHEGGWTRTFAVSKTPSTYLINARREFVWKHEGAADATVLAAALDEHLVPAPAPRSSPLRLAVSPGNRAPDVVFEDRGEGFALHRLRGREVLLNFWQSWLAPCLKELRRLQQLQKHTGGRAPFIVAFHGGKDRQSLDEIRKQHGLTFPLVQDADQVIARRYGVRCWPTTVSVNADGLVSHVQFGLSHEHAPLPERKEAGSY